MSEDYRVPVERVKAQVWLVKGEERDLELFCPPEATVESLLDDDRRFLPAMEAESVCLVSRESVVAIRVEASQPPTEQDEDAVNSLLPMVSRGVTITLESGQVVKGDIRFVASGVQDRTADFLNTDATFFTVHRPEDVIHIVKRHVLVVVEG